MTQKSHYKDRTNEEWVAQLRGERGANAQAQAYTDLTRYLYLVLYNYLRMRQASVPGLARLANADLTEIAEDLVHDVLMRLPKLLSAFRSQGRFLSYASTVAINTARQQLKREEWHLQIEPLKETIDDEAPLDIPDKYQEIAAVLNTLEDPSATPELVALRAEIWDVIRKCLESLPDKQRKALILGTIEGRSNAEIAEQLGVPPEVVYSLRHRAIKQMQRRLAEVGYSAELILSAFTPSSSEGMLDPPH